MYMELIEVDLKIFICGGVTSVIKMVSDIWEVISILLVENELKPLDYTGPQLDYHKVDDTIEAEEKKLLLNSPKSKFKII